MKNQEIGNSVAMTPTQTKLIRETWDKVVPIADDAARMFCQRLFEIDPGTKSLFAETDMAQQRGKLLKALGLVVEHADKPENLAPVLEELGRSHVRYGVKDKHYESVGAALIWTLEQGLGAAFTGAVRSAWTKLYTIVSEPMRRAAAEVAAATSRRSTLRHAAVAVCLTLGLAGGLTATTAAIGPDQAHAFGLGDITDAAKKVGGAAKKVGGAAKKGAKSVGKAGASVGVHAGKTTVRAAQGARDISLYVAGRASIAPLTVFSKGYLRASGQWNEETRQFVKDMERDWVDGFDNAGDKMDRGIRRVGQAAGEYARTGGVTSGESLPRPEPSPEAKRRMQNGLRDFANGGGVNRQVQTGLAKGGAFYKGRQGMTRKGAKTTVQGITRENLKPGTSTFNGTKKGNRMVRKGTNFRNTVVRDRSLADRPVGLTLDGKALPRHGAKPNQHPRPITANDIKPSFCNSKFQNCSRNRVGHGRKGNMNDARDRSVMGRPLGITKTNVQARQKVKRSVRNKSGKNRAQQNHRPQTRDMSRNSGRSQSRNQHQNRNKHQGQKVRMHNNRSSGRRG
ncbi:MAG: globin domain-containing protein [Hyphomicrobiales bacterium]|nr:globin domain-containing protein [Hyphomicrobiales bacterium]